jgi:shikimate dehydrogenase
VARDRERCAPLLVLAGRIGIEARWLELGAPVRGVSAVVSTIPADVAAVHAASIADTPVLLDAIYDPWPTPLAAAVEAAGGRTISGLQMLLHQAFAQVEQFTGMPAPKAAMRAALVGS